MRSHVLVDARLARHAGRFVWLEIDFEKERNAEFVERYPVDVFPTFLVIDPATEEVVERWRGSLSAKRLDARLATAAGARRRPPATLEARAVELQAKGEHAACARLVRERAPRLARGESWAGAVATGVWCALELPEGGERRATIAALERHAAEAARLPGLLADDRSGAYAALHAAREARGDPRGAARAARAWWAFLDAEAERAGGPERRAFLDGARISAARALGEPARAIPPLERSARELPADYNPPARLAALYHEVGRNEDALAAADRALALAYGPRKLRVYRVKAWALAALGDREALAGTLAEALEHGARLPEAQRGGRAAELLEEMRAELAELRGGG
jgi:hypothetical protein